MAGDETHDDGTETTESTTQSEPSGSRRRFLAGATGTVGALALGSAFGVQPALAEDDDMFEDDVAILNYALTLEYLEAAFYRRALDNIDQDELFGERADELPEDVRERLYEDLTVIKDHEETHAEYLVEVIEERDGEPIDEPEFEFGSAVEAPDEFLQTAAVLEDTGVGAYAGAAPLIEDPELVPPALSIHSVEGRHASFVRELGGEIGFPEAFDEALEKDEVLDAASQFIVESDDEC